jgi:hypothetical protein
LIQIKRGGEVLDGKEAIEQFKEWYMESYGVKPTEKLIETFCKMKGIDIEQVKEQNRKEVAKVEEQAEYKVCSVLQDVPTVATASTQIPFTEENFRALETNYQNLLADYEEVSAIAQAKDREISILVKHLTKATSDIKALLNMIKPYRDMLSAMDFKALQEIEKDVEDLKNGNGSTESVK